MIFLQWRIRRLSKALEKELRAVDFSGRIHSQCYYRGVAIAKKLAKILNHNHLLIPFNALINEYTPFVPMEPIKRYFRDILY